MNNAGIAAAGPVETTPDAVWRRVMETNLFGALACIRALAPGMRERHSGTIVNVTSISGRLATPGFGPYSASKFALEAVSETLRLELRAFGVRSWWSPASTGRRSGVGITARPRTRPRPTGRSWIGASTPCARRAAGRRRPGRGGAPHRGPPGAPESDPSPPGCKAGGAPVDALIRRHLEAPWEELEAAYLPD